MFGLLLLAVVASRPGIASAAVVTPAPATTTIATLAAAAGDTTARPITLDEAVAMAERNAPSVIQAEGQRRTSAAGVRAAYASFIPSLSLSAGASRQLQKGQTQYQSGQALPPASEPWTYNAGLSANVDLFLGGRRFFDLAQTRAQVGVANANLVTQRYDAVLAAKQQFFAVLAARESELAARAQLEQAQQQLHASVLQLRARLVTRSDSLRSEIAVHNAQLAVTQSRVALDQANASLTRAVGAPSPVTAASDSLPPEGLAVDDPALRALALNGPLVRQSAASLDAARSALRSSWTTYLPTLSAGYARRGSGIDPGFTLSPANSSYNGSFTLSLSFPIFDQLQRQQQVTQAQVARDEAEAAARDTRLAALESLTQWLGAYHAAEEQVQLQSATLQAAEEDLREQTVKYKLGTSTLLDVLTSQTTLNQARHDLIQARYNQRVAKAQLEALVGRNL
ncbi:MAG TPA: TolC family protein [Terriglobales bacterium]|nr:TolC family protein [Terriglobales bacterium]